MVTDNPDNVILPEQWHPVPDVVETPVKGITLGDGRFRKVMENTLSDAVVYAGRAGVKTGARER